MPPAKVRQRKEKQQVQLDLLFFLSLRMKDTTQILHFQFSIFHSLDLLTDMLQCALLQTGYLRL